MKKNSINIKLFLLMFSFIFVSIGLNSSVFAETKKFDYSKYELGSGTPAYVDLDLIQKGAKEGMLSEIIKLRKEALNDTRIKWPTAKTGMTMKEYLKANGISEEDYLNPKWSYELEMLAINRTVETAMGGKTGHFRLNGEGVFTPTYDNVKAYGEIIAWGENGFATSTDQWANSLCWWQDNRSEKQHWIEGLTNLDTGHYTTLISPENKFYGMAGIKGNFVKYGSAWVGLASGESLNNQKSTNFTGKRRMKVMLSDKIFNAIKNNPKINVKVIKAGESVSPKVTCTAKNYTVNEFNIPSKMFIFDGKWSSKDSKILKVVDNKLVGVKDGSTTVTLTTENGKKFTFPMKVVGILSATNYTETVDSGKKPTLPKEVEVTYSDGSKSTAKVIWSSFDDSLWKKREGGDFEVEGTIEGFDKVVKSIIKVEPATVKKVIVEGSKNKEILVVTESGVKPKLPEKVDIIWSNEDITKKQSINWDENTGYKNRKGGSYTLEGTINGSDIKVKITVKVNPATVKNVYFEGTKNIEIAVTTESGTKPKLPLSANVIWSNEDEVVEKISWEDNAAYKNREGANYRLKGNVEGKSLIADVTVNPATLNSVNDVEMTVDCGVKPELPKTVKVYWSNGDSFDAAVTWNEIYTKADYSKKDGNYFEVDGVVILKPVVKKFSVYALGNNDTAPIKAKITVRPLAEKKNPTDEKPIVKTPKEEQPVVVVPTDEKPVVKEPTEKNTKDKKATTKKAKPVVKNNLPKTGDGLNLDHLALATFLFGLSILGFGIFTRNK